MKLKSDLPQIFCTDTINTVVFLINRGPSTQLENCIRKEELMDKKVSLSYLRIFDCIVYVHVDSSSRSKFDAKSIRSTFISYGGDEFGYRFWDKKNQKIILVKMLCSINR